MRDMPEPVPSNGERSTEMSTESPEVETRAPVQPPAGTYRIQGKRFFWTIPHCDMDPTVALKRVMDWRRCDRVMVARERHKDDTNHLHVALWLTKRVDVSTCASIDAIFAQHGNYQTMRDPVAVVKYLMKENDYVSHGFDPKEYVKASGRKRAYSWNDTADHIQSGGALADIPDKGFAARNLRKLVEYQRWWRTLHAVHRTGSWSVRTLVLWGRTGSGKSYWARHGHGLDGGVYVLPYQRAGGVWWDGYGGERILLLDDFDPSKMPLLQLLRVLDSYKMTGMVKGATVTADWTDVIITNNEPPSRWYPQASLERMAALMRRMKVCYIAPPPDETFRTIPFDTLYADTAWPVDNYTNVSSNLVE